MLKKVKKKLRLIFLKSKRANFNKLKQLLKKIRYFDYFLEINKSESDYINAGLEEKEKDIIKQIYKNRKLLSVAGSQSYNDNELNNYINKIFEQQEKEKIVRWLVNSIRESLDLDKVLERIVDEIGRLLKVDRCLIALYDKDAGKFHFQNEYRINENIQDALNNSGSLMLELPQNWHEHLLKSNSSIVINNFEDEKLDENQKKYLEINNIKSLIIIPVAHKNEILGVIMVHQIHYNREWESTHIEILKDTGSQIAVAIGQAILYTKVQETTKLKSEFLAGMSHEFRTPLNAIIGFSEMLLNEDFGKLNEKQQRFANNVVLSGRHLLRLVNDILDISKVESGNLELNYEEFKVNSAIFETVSILKGMAIKKNISIETNLSENIIINADIGRFNQIMYNLISNAIKFTEDNGKIFINSKFIRGDLKVEIIDTGIGIAEENRDKVFQEFRQIDSFYARKQEGTGLGLTLAKKLVERHNGSIDFDSKEENGSKFWFILPEAKLAEKINI